MIALRGFDHLRRAVDADDAQGIGEGVCQNLRAVAGAASHIEQLAGLFKADAFDQIDGRLRPFGLEAEIGGGIPLHGVASCGLKVSGMFLGAFLR